MTKTSEVNVFRMLVTMPEEILDTFIGKVLKIADFACIRYNPVDRE